MFKVGDKCFINMSYGLLPVVIVGISNDFERYAVSLDDSGRFKDVVVDRSALVPWTSGTEFEFYSFTEIPFYPFDDKISAEWVCVDDDTDAKAKQQ